MYSPDANVNVNQVNILLIGAIGAGKSGFVNTICSIFRNVSSQKCFAGTNASTDKSVTRMYRQHAIYSAQRKTYLNFKLCDTYGLMDVPNVDNGDLTFLLKGNIQDKYMFQESIPITPNAAHYKATPEFRDRMHCVVFVCDATTIEEFSQHCLQEFLKLIEQMRAEDVPRAVLLTKIDQLSKCLDHDVSTVFRNKKVSHAVEIAAKLFEVPGCYIHPVKNYEKEVMLNDEINCLALMALDHILDYAVEFVRDN